MFYLIGVIARKIVNKVNDSVLQNSEQTNDVEQTIPDEKNNDQNENV